MNALQTFRAEKDEFFRHHDQSPLTAEQKRRFTGLAYFPENAALRFEADVVPSSGQQNIEIPTSTGEAQVYHRHGKVRMQIEGQTVELTIFSNEHGLFLPFVDSQANELTYPAGRYLEPELIGNGKVRIDFNLAYNPYCAYNDHWSCPLTPFENRLKVPVRAGEQIFEKHPA